MIDVYKNEKLKDIKPSKSDKFIEIISNDPANTLAYVKDLSLEIQSDVELAVLQIKRAFDNSSISLVLSGSLARNEYLPTSDCDINLIIPGFQPNDKPKIKKLLENRFIEVDLFIYGSFSEIENLANYSIMEFNKLSGAIFYNPLLSSQIKTDLLSKDNFITDFLFEYHYLYQYKNYRSFDQDGFDFKYDYGNVRDFLLINTIGSIEGVDNQNNKKTLIESTLEGLNALNLISDKEFEELLSSVRLLAVVKSLSKSVLDDSDKSKKINSYNLYRIFTSNSDTFIKLGLRTYDEFQLAYYTSKKYVSNFIVNYYEKLKLRQLSGQTAGHRWIEYESNYQKISACKNPSLLYEFSQDIINSSNYKWENFVTLLQNPHLDNQSINLIKNQVNSTPEFNKFISAQIAKHPNYEK